MTNAQEEYPTPKPTNVMSRRLVVSALLVGTLLAVVLAFVVVTFTDIGAEDSGVRACKAMAESINNDNNPGTNEDFTEDEYREVRKLFSESKHEDIRTNGTELVDLAWQLQLMDDDAGFEALPFVGPFTSAYTGLSGGCAEQDVVLPPLEF